MAKIIIGLTGTIGSGKDTVARYLESQHNFLSRFGSDLLAEKLQEQGLPLTRENYHTLANEIRKNGRSLLGDDPVFHSILKGNQSAVVGFFRSPIEIQDFKELIENAPIIALDAPLEIRYERIRERKSGKDNISFEQFLEEEQQEMESDDPYKHNVRACIEQADFMIYNDSTKEELYKKIDEILEKIES